MKHLLRVLLSYLPSKLPVGITEFNAFADEIIELSGEFADRDSMRFAIASMIIHSDSKRGSIPKNRIVNMLRKSAANQVASQVFQEIKQQQQDIAAKQAAEATALLNAVVSEEKEV